MKIYLDVIKFTVSTSARNVNINFQSWQKILEHTALVDHFDRTLIYFFYFDKTILFMHIIRLYDIVTILRIAF